MRKIKKTIGLALIALTLIGVIALGGCEKSEVSEPSVVTDEQILSMVSMSELAKVSVIKDPQILAEVDWLWKNHLIPTKELFCNVHRNGLEFHVLGDGDAQYLISGMNDNDLLITRNYVKQQLNIERFDKSARHYKQSNMFSGGSVKVRIHDNVPTEWRTAITDACGAWNGLGQNISITSYVASNNTSKAGEVDIDFSSLADAKTIAGTTTVKSGTGGVSEIIYINSTSNIISTIHQSARAMTMAHELGHSIGLGHTDYAETGMTQVAAILACNGVVNYTDPSSIMRRSIPFNQSWTGFTSCDVNVVNYYW